MTRRISTCSALAAALIASPAIAEIGVVVQEDFESYNSTGDFEAVWNPDTSTRQETDPLPELVTDFGNPGQSVLHPGDGLNFREFDAPIVPTEEEWIKVSVDIFDEGITSNKRVTLGLRNFELGQNLLELGHWNAFSTEDPAGFPPYSFRTILFDAGSEVPDVGGGGGWDFFDMGTEMIEVPIDPEDPDAGTEMIEVNVNRTQEGWHRWMAVIKPEEIEISFDLFADGDIDATRTVAAITSENGFTEVRFGTPGDFSSLGDPDVPGSGAGHFDNILVEVIEAATAVPGDADGDGDVDAFDLGLWQTQFGQTGEGLSADFDADGDVDAFDLGIWQINFGTGLDGAAVPEPASLALIGLGALATLRRRR